MVDGVGFGGVSFDAQALRDAIEARRQARGVGWEVVAEEAGVKAWYGRRLARASTANHDAEALLRLATWAGCALESFTSIGVDGHGDVVDLPAHEVVLDPRVVVAEVDAGRTAEGLSWHQAAAEVGTTAGALARIDRGGSVRVKLLLHVCRWRECSPASLVERSRRELVGT